MRKKYSYYNLIFNLLNYNANLIGNIPPNLVKGTKIKFKCCCGQYACKTFESIFNGVAKCRKCVQKIAVEKYKNTCMQRYGVVSTSQLESTKEKTRQTMKTKYGAESFFQSNKYKECRQVYTMELLLECIENHNAKYLKYERTPLDRESFVYFICKCENRIHM